MLVGVSFLPLSFLRSQLWNIGILHNEKAKLRKHMRQSVGGKKLPEMVINGQTQGYYLLFETEYISTVNSSTPDILAPDFSSLDLSTPDFPIMNFSTTNF